MRRELIAVVALVALVMVVWGCVALGATTPSVDDVLTSAGKTCVYSVTTVDGSGYVEVPCKRASRSSERNVFVTRGPFFCDLALHDPAPDNDLANC